MLTRPHFEVQDILAHSFDGFRLNNQLDKDQYKAANDILRCRTAVLAATTAAATAAVPSAAPSKGRHGSREGSATYWM